MQQPKLRKATPRDIVEDAEIIYPATQYYEEFIAIVDDVLNPSSDWKAFSARDGCRYGLDGAYVVDTIPLYLYKLSQSINNDYDASRSIIVCAASEDDACKIHPDGKSIHDMENWRYIDSKTINEWASMFWCHPLNVKVELIGMAGDHVETGVI